MGAEFAVEVDEAGLVELTDEVGGGHHHSLHRGRVARVGAQIAAAQLVRGKERGASGQVEDEVAGRSGPVPRLTEDEAGARGRGRQGVVVDA